MVCVSFQFVRRPDGRRCYTRILNAECRRGRACRHDHAIGENSFASPQPHRARVVSPADGLSEGVYYTCSRNSKTDRSRMCLSIYCGCISIVLSHRFSAITRARFLIGEPIFPAHKSLSSLWKKSRNVQSNFSIACPHSLVLIRVQLWVGRMPGHVSMLNRQYRCRRRFCVFCQGNITLD